MLPGFQQRVQEEVMRAFEEVKSYQKIRRLAVKVRFIRSVFAPNCVAWVGGMWMFTSLCLFWRVDQADVSCHLIRISCGSSQDCN